MSVAEGESSRFDKCANVTVLVKERSLIRRVTSILVVKDLGIIEAPSPDWII